VIVVDSSAAVLSFIGVGERATRCRRTLALDRDWSVPQHWGAEVFSAIRGLTLSNKISASAARLGLDLLARSGAEEVRLVGKLERMWALRHNFSAYDAPYVVLAAEHGLTLVTGDVRLARAAVAHCRVQLV
jgi:predicted nucleic acid-binding protein